jgi:hypothetical protein
VREKQRTSRFLGLIRGRGQEKKALFQPLATEIRYSADQPNFVKDQRIKTAVATEYQWKFGRGRKASETQLKQDIPGRYSPISCRKEKEVSE